MNSENKTIEQLSGKLLEMRQRIVQLEGIEKELRATQERLKEFEIKFNTIFDNSLDIYMIIDGTRGRIRQVNPLASYILGYKKEELTGKHYSEIFHNEIKNKKVLEDFEIEDSVIYKDVICADGKTIPMDVTVTVIDWDKEKALFATLRDSRERKRAQEERERLILELQEALKNIKTLKGLLPICASCKKIRDDKGYWSQVEEYIGHHSEVEFTHGICPDCMQKLYPAYARDNVS